MEEITNTSSAPAPIETPPPPSEPVAAEPAANSGDQELSEEKEWREYRTESLPVRRSDEGSKQLAPFEGPQSQTQPLTPYGRNNANDEPDPLNLAWHRRTLGDHADEIIRTATRDLRRDPELWGKLQECHTLYSELAQHEAAGDRLAAAGAITEIALLERKLQNAFRRFAIDRITSIDGALSDTNIRLAYGFDLVNGFKLANSKR